MKNIIFKGPVKNAAIIIAAAVIVIIFLLALLFLTHSTFNIRSFLGIETRAQQEVRLKAFSKGLPTLNGTQPIYQAGIDGECSELTDSSALAAVRAIEPLGTSTFTDASTDFINQTKASGIEWYGNLKSSKPFTRDGKTYKLSVLNYQQDDKMGVEVTACN